MYADAGDARQPLSGVKFNEVPGLMLERPASPRALETETTAEKQLKQLIKTQGRAIDTLFNPTELRAHKITDLAKSSMCFRLLASNGTLVLGARIERRYSLIIIVSTLSFCWDTD